MLDLRRLRLLSELARRGTIAEVAAVVGYTPSAVSQSLAQLERETDVALLERDGRRASRCCSWCRPGTRAARSASPATPPGSAGCPARSSPPRSRRHAPRPAS